MPVKTQSLPPPRTSATGIASRDAALSLLKAGLERRGGFDDAAGRPPFTALPPQERPFARALAATAFRRLAPIDRMLGAKLERTPPTAVMNLLRLGVAQLAFMNTPAHAAVSTTMAQAEARGDTRAFKGLINAVLRGVGRDLEDSGTAEALSHQGHAPDWLNARWRAAYGDAAAEAIAARIPEDPPTDLSLRDPDDAAWLAEALVGAEADVAAAGTTERLPGGGVRTWRRGDLSEWPGFAEGRWWVQDVSAAIPARLLHVQAGETALDLCAAPGGKTLQLAAAGARVTALDRSAPRLKRLTENLTRMGLTAEVVAEEASAWTDRRPFDAVLLDAPCSATGTFRRHPDVLWAARPGDIAKLAALQTLLMDSAVQRVRVGGRLVYCVCSLEPEEGEAQASAFLARHGDKFERSPIRPGEGGAPPEAATRTGDLRIHPGMSQPRGGGDGFFVARFARTR